MDAVTRLVVQGELESVTPIKDATDDMRSAFNLETKHFRILGHKSLQIKTAKGYESIRKNQFAEKRGTQRGASLIWLFSR